MKGQTTMKTFTDLFESSEPWTTGPHDTHYRAWTISGYCLVNAAGEGYRGALNVKPTLALCEFIEANMLSIQHDAIYFEIIVHNDGDAVVWAKYNQILGSRKVATIPASEVLARIAAK